MPRRFGAVVTPESVGDVVDCGRIGFTARDAVEVAGMTARFNDLREEGASIGDVCQGAPRQVHPRIGMTIVEEENTAAQIGQFARG